MFDFHPTAVKIWWRYQRHAHDARRWLRGNGPTRTAAYAMFHLNHVAASGRSRHMIYSLKSLFIRHLYEAGYCTAVSVQKQTQGCWSCGGSGIDSFSEDDGCWKCCGTGVYREHSLYRFVFDVDGRTYIWHQPKALVSWPVQITELGLSEFTGGARFSRPVPNTEAGELYLVTLLTYLKQQGIAVPGNSYYFTSLRYCLGEDVRRYRRRRRQAGSWKQNTQKLWHVIRTGQLPAVDDDDIPF